MPSPVGHALAGLIIGEMVAPSALLICAATAVVPDLDLLWGGHRAATHSVGAALIAGAAVFAWKRNPRLAVAVALSWLTHVGLDWLAADDTPPFGLMAFWPLNSNFYLSNAHIFDTISRRYWLDNFVTHNVWAVIKEVLILGPITFTAFRWRKHRRVLETA